MSSPKHQINTEHWKIEIESRWKKFRTIKDKLKYFCKNLGQSRSVLKIQEIPGLSRTVGTMKYITCCEIQVALLYANSFLPIAYVWRKDQHTCSDVHVNSCQWIATCALDINQQHQQMSQFMILCFCHHHISNQRRNQLNTSALSMLSPEHYHMQLKQNTNWKKNFTIYV